MKYGEIWMVNFNPSIGVEIKKKRPAIIITANKIIKYSNLITVMPITSNINNIFINDIKIFKDKDNCLFADSIIKVCSINSFDKGSQRFVKKVGVANEYIMDQIKKYLKKHCNL